MAARKPESRPVQFEKALDYMRRWAPPQITLQAAGIDPATITAEEREQLEAAELTAEHEALSNVKRAAESDPEAARWFREWGLRG